MYSVGVEQSSIGAKHFEFGLHDIPIRQHIDSVEGLDQCEEMI